MRLLIFLFLFSCQSVEPEKIPVFFVGGQSNAKPQFKTGIDSALSFKYDSYKLRYTNHPGSPLRDWYDVGIKSLLEIDIQVIADGFDLQSDELKGIFWFQGESDLGPDDVHLYSERFLGMVSEYENIFNSDDIKLYLVLIDRNKDLSELESDRLIGLRTQQMILSLKSGGEFIDSRPYKRVDEWHIPPKDLISLGYKLGMKIK